MKFCPTCGYFLIFAIPPGDTRKRHMCRRCGTIHYSNPRIVVGSLSTWGNKVLLCRRAIEPRRGYWTLPAGFLENGESSSEGAKRETREEAGSEVEIVNLFSFLDVPHLNQVHLFFRATPHNEEVSPGPESLEAKFFEISSIPWNLIAFRTVTHTLEWFKSESQEPNSTPKIYSKTILPEKEASKKIST